jgi:hypothetical protein
MNGTVHDISRLVWARTSDSGCVHKKWGRIV